MFYNFKKLFRRSALTFKRALTFKFQVKLNVMVLFELNLYVLLAVFTYTLCFPAESAHFRGGAYFPDSLAKVEKGAYFRGALIPLRLYGTRCYKT